MPKPLILADPELYSAGRELWTSPEMDTPQFNVTSVATCFFGRSPSWVRKHLDESVEPDKRPPRTEHNYRRFRLYDIERMAHSLAEVGIIQGQELELVVTMVKTCARLNGMIK